jgi:hypothetical protein
MRHEWLAVGLAAFLAITTISVRGSVAPQPPDAEDPGRPSVALPDGVFWPTQKMLEGVLRRIVEDMARDYDFDEDQRERTLDLLRERISGFLNRNRSEIQALMARYFEAVLNDEPPLPEEVADWARRVLPLMQEFRESVDGLAEQMREYLTDDQIATLEGNLAAFHTGMDFANRRMQDWAEGGYDPQTEWHRNSGAREAERQRRAAIRQEMAAQRQAAIERVRREQELSSSPPQTVVEQGASRAPGSPVTQPAVGDEWERYVETFIRRYDLNHDQKQQAYRFLRQQQAERDRYLKRREREMQRLLEAWRSASSPEQVARAEADYARFMQPIDGLFERLKSRLEQIPTRAQRREAEAGTPETRNMP